MEARSGVYTSTNYKIFFNGYNYRVKKKICFGLFWSWCETGGGLGPSKPITFGTKEAAEEFVEHRIKWDAMEKKTKGPWKEFLG